MVKNELSYRVEIRIEHVIGGSFLEGDKRAETFQKSYELVLRVKGTPSQVETKIVKSLGLFLALALKNDPHSGNTPFVGGNQPEGGHLLDALVRIHKPVLHLQHPDLLPRHEQQEEREDAPHALPLKGGFQVSGDEVVQIEQILIGVLEPDKKGLQVRCRHRREIGDSADTLQRNHDVGLGIGKKIVHVGKIRPAEGIEDRVAGRCNAAELPSGPLPHRLKLPCLEAFPARVEGFGKLPPGRAAFQGRKGAFRVADAGNEEGVILVWMGRPVGRFFLRNVAR